MDQASTLRRLMEEKKKKESRALGRPGRVISITSGKGGVGKTNLVANMAIGLQRSGHRVLILDGDLGLANIDIIYNLSPKFSIKHLLSGSKPIDDVLVEGPEGIKILPAASGVAELAQLSESEKTNLVAELERVQDRFDILLLDTAAGISKNVLYLNSAAETILIVVTPEPTSITDAYALIKVMSAQYSEKEFWIVVNSARSEKEAIEVYQSIQRAADQFLSDVLLEYVDYIPYDENVRKSVRNQRPFVLAFPNSPASNAVRTIGNKLMQEHKGRVKGGMQFFFQKILAGGRG